MRFSAATTGARRWRWGCCVSYFPPPVSLRGETGQMIAINSHNVNDLEAYLLRTA
jgi:hypothetical protein